MRDIKFRAWFKGGLEFGQQYKGMYEVTTINWEEKYVAVKRSSTFAQGIFILDAIELMQYTGLKDSKGKEIYEGDIVKYWYPISKPLTKTGAVYWEDNDGCWFMYDGHFENDQSRITASIAEKSEVIGNIYENRELLKGVK